MLVYGDSVSLGVLVNQNATFSAVLEDLFRQAPAGRSVEILNMARGNSPSIYAVHAKKDIPQFRPDLVVLQIELANDVADEAFVKFDSADEYGLPDPLQTARYLLSWDRKIVGIIPINGYFFEATKAYSDLTHRIGNWLSSRYPNPLFSSSSTYYYYNLGFDQFYLTEERLSSAFQRMFKVINGIKHFSEKNGAKFLLLITPSSYVFDSNQFQQGSNELVERAVASAIQLKIPHISVLKRFKENGGSNLYFDFCHPVPKGHQLIAEELFKEIASKLKKD